MLSDDLKVKGITIHNTGSDKSAIELAEELKARRQERLCHVIIDQHGAVQMTPFEKMAWHTGKGYDFGNKYTIAIEICDGEENLKKAVEYIKALMERYGLTADDLYFHNDFDGLYYCPGYILKKHISKSRFIDKYFGKENA